MKTVVRRCVSAGALALAIVAPTFSQAGDLLPKLDLPMKDPVVLHFVDTDTREIYVRLGTMQGINILLDAQIREKKMSVDLAYQTWQQALDSVLLVNQHYVKVIDPHTLIVIPDNQTKRRQYDELAIQTFYLKWADVNDVQQLVQRLLNTRFMSTSKAQNAVTVRDTYDKVRIAERLVAAIDKPQGEVAIDVELYETRLPADAIPAPEALRRAGRLIGRPQLRALDGEKTSVSVTRSVPVGYEETSSKDDKGVESRRRAHQYRDAGTSVTLEPRFRGPQSLELKVKVDAGFVAGASSDGVPCFVWRKIESTLSLKDGETGVLRASGPESEGEGATSCTGDSAPARSPDLVLLVTPHVLRAPAPRPEDLAPLFVGTEDNTELRSR